MASEIEEIVQRLARAEDDIAQARDDFDRWLQQWRLDPRVLARRDIDTAHGDGQQSVTIGMLFIGYNYPHDAIVLIGKGEPIRLPIKAAQLLEALASGTDSSHNGQAPQLVEWKTPAHLSDFTWGRWRYRLKKGALRAAVNRLRNRLEHDKLILTRRKPTVAYRLNIRKDGWVNTVDPRQAESTQPLVC